VRYHAILFSAAWVTFAALGAIHAQQFSDPLRAGDRSGLGVIGQFEASAGIGVESATLTSQIAPATGDRPAILLLSVKIASGKHTYSLTQPAGGPLPSTIELEPSRDYRLLGEFRAYPPAHSRIESGPIWTGLEIQEHEGEFTWFAPLEISAGVDPATLDIKGTLQMSVCETGGYCEPVEKAISARLTDDAKVPAEIEDELVKSASDSREAAGKQDFEAVWSSGNYQADSSAVKLSGQLVPATVRPGDSSELRITAALPKGSRIYAHADRDNQKGTKPVLIAVERASGLLPRRATTDAPMKIDNSVPQMGVMKYHEGEVTWTVPIEVPKSAPPGDYTIDGLLGYQSCGLNEDGKEFCEFPQSVRFQATLKVGNATNSTAAPIQFAAGGGYPAVAKAAAAFASSLGDSAGETIPTGHEKAPTSKRPDEEPSVISAADQYDLSQVRVDNTTRSIGHYIALAFVGGLILNLMPCVLPVISLKVMSFVEQAGKSRAHAFALNLWYAAGIIAVFLLLGLLAATIKLSWGEQFGSTAFNVTVACVVFAMALSLLGVWEVPIPGFFGSGSVQKAAA
jgi:hypothetical protein